MIMKIILSLGDCWKMKKSSGTGSQGNFIAISCNFPLEEIIV